MPAAVLADPLGVEGVSVLINHDHAPTEDDASCFGICDHVEAGVAVDDLHHLMLLARRARIAFV